MDFSSYQSTFLAPPYILGLYVRKELLAFKDPDVNCKVNSWLDEDFGYNEDQICEHLTALGGLNFDRPVKKVPTQEPDSFRIEKRPSLKSSIVMQDEANKGTYKMSGSPRASLTSQCESRPSLAALLESSLSGVKKAEEGPLRKVTAGEQDDDQAMHTSRATLLDDDSLLSSLASMNNLCAPRYDHRKATRIYPINDTGSENDLYDPDPRDLLPPPASPRLLLSTIPQTTCPTLSHGSHLAQQVQLTECPFMSSRSSSSDLQVSSQATDSSPMPTHSPPTHLRVWEVKYGLESGRRNAWAVKLWRARRSFLAMEL
ncbi:MAG: hypothetical protein Q9165_003826 [Trypethelium subeluteriae]